MKQRLLRETSCKKLIQLERTMGIEPASEPWEALNMLIPFSAGRAAIYFTVVPC